MNRGGLNILKPSPLLPLICRLFLPLSQSHLVLNLTANILLQNPKHRITSIKILVRAYIHHIKNTLNAVLALIANNNQIFNPTYLLIHASYSLTFSLILCNIARLLYRSIKISLYIIFILISYCFIIIS